MVAALPPTTQTRLTIRLMIWGCGVWGEFEASNTLGSSTHRVVERRRISKRRRSRNYSLVVIDSSGDVTSESDVESVFENSSSKRSKSGSWGGSQGSSIYYSDNEDITTPTTHLRIHPPIPVVDLAEWQNDCSSTELHDTSNLVHDIDPKIDAGDSDSDDSNGLSHSPSWYRFKPSTATIEGSCTIMETGHR
ncbi:hypothetical protein DL95DRAFT_407314 [Leptodontidium sp. 2 PMI_412]|nr:hypothetical protein DL95DRAFT_407314 [Leptodontidium sp. 2 PMI_412]